METHEAAAGPSVAADMQNAAHSVKDEVKTLLRETRDETTQAASKAREQVGDIAQRQRQQASDTLGSLSGALRDTSEKLRTDEQRLLGGYASTVADQVEQLAGYLRTKDVAAIVRDAETLARRHPDAFLGGAVAVGLAAGRFLKSTGAARTAEAQPAPAPASPPAPAAAFIAVEVPALRESVPGGPFNTPTLVVGPDREGGL